jgi:hypothetical protein
MSDPTGAGQAAVDRALDYLTGGDRPTAPATGCWERTLGGLVRAALGNRVPDLVARRLTGYGELHLAPTELGLDGDRISWSRIDEIHLRPARDSLIQATAGNAASLTVKLLLPSKWLGRQIDGLVAALVRTALDRLPSGSTVELPAEVVHRSCLGSRKHLPLGLFPTALLAHLPDATASLLTTADRHRVPVR